MELQKLLLEVSYFYIKILIKLFRGPFKVKLYKYPKNIYCSKA
jgi:hypothetical protein